MKLLNFIIFASSSILTTFWLYLFFSRKLRSITLFPLQPETFSYIKTFFLFAISLFFLSLMMLIYKKAIYPKRNKNSVISKGIEKINKFIDKINIFYKSYGMLLDFLGLDYAQYLIRLAKFTMSLTYKQVQVILFCFVTLPRCVILVTFLTEIFIGQLHYFFYTLFLIILSLVFRLIIFMLTDIGPRLFPEFDKLVKKTPEIHEIQTKTGFEKIEVIAISFIKNLADVDFNFFATTYYYPLMHIGPYMRNHILPLYAKIAQYTLLSYFFILTCGLIYILYFN